MRAADRESSTVLQPLLMKENGPMKKRSAIVTATLCVALMLLVILPTATASAASPWWQVLTGSRPTNLWEPTDNVQEITATMEANEFGEGVVHRMEISGETLGCLGSETFLGEFGCQIFVGSPAITNAAQLKTALEPFYGGNVEVSGGPVGVTPLVVTVPGLDVPLIVFKTKEEAEKAGEVQIGSVTNKLLSQGGSGRLVLTLTNLGDAPVDGTGSPVRIVDKLPKGVIASGVEAIAGARDTYGPVACEVKAPSEVTCTYEGELPPYEAIEIEVLVGLTGAPPVAGDPGEVTVSGGNAAPASAVQKVNVTSEPVPFGIERFEAEAEQEGGSPVIQAGSHPLQFTTTLQLNAGAVSPSGIRTGLGSRDFVTKQPAMPRDLRFPLPAGLVGNATVVPTCDMGTFLKVNGDLINECPDATALGVTSVTIVESGNIGLARLAVPVFNLPPAHGEPARFGFVAMGVPVVIDTAVDPEDDYRIMARVRNINQSAQFLAATTTFWGTPGDPRHDIARGWNCLYFAPTGPCTVPPQSNESAFLRMPVQCFRPLIFEASLEPWNFPTGSVVSTASFPGSPLQGCNRIPFNPDIQGAPSSKLAENPSGLSFSLTMPNSGLLDRDAIAEGQAKKVEVTLPEGMSINPSQGEGLVGCNPAEYARENVGSQPGEGCPEASKIGTVQISTPLLAEDARGSVFVASPHDNPFDSLLALYVVAKIPERGILIKQAGRVDTDPTTGQIRTTFDNLPQVPFDSFNLEFRPGGRAPLVTPAACGSYDVVARFTPWSATDPNNPAPEEIVTRTSTFEVEHGVDGGACPSGGVPPFRPGLIAGTLNNAAGKYSPFNLRLTRNDGEQEFTNFSVKLPPGVVGKLAGIPFCSDQAIAAAKARTGANGGQEELDDPSCPAASQVGRTLVGAGVGNSLTYVPGKVYMAGPYNGARLSVVAITAAEVGPFDLGTVVIRQALKIDPVTAEVSVDAGSDPLPHIIQGIPVRARDIRVYVDRSEFVLNPTSCERTATASTVVGSGLDFRSDADNVPVTVTSPFQAADCASLGFKPRLKLTLRGKTTRGGNPALRAVLRPRKGDANAARISVALPHSEFLDQSHIRTVCTRVQFKAGTGNGTQCPRGAIYGRAKAWTPLFDKPLEGPIFLRSSDNPLPDMVLALHGLVDIHAVGRIDSVKGGIRNTFDFVPDAPITKVIVNLQGGKKGLLENSTNICRGKHKATVKMKGHNGKRRNLRVPLRAKCPKKKNAKRRR